MNGIKTFLLLTGLTLMLIWIGGALGGRTGMMFAFVFACIMNFGAYWFSDSIVLSMYRAHPVTREQAPELYGIVEELTANADMPMPRVYRIPNSTPNAFATGRDPEHAVVAVTEGLLDILNYEELRGVIAHELAHVKHRDILICSIAATLAGAISMIASMARWAFIFGGGRGNSRDSNPIGLIVTAIVAPIAAMLVQMAVSRSREYEADRGGAEISRDPGSLASALRKLEMASKQIPMRDVNPATAHMFIVNPLHGGMASLFSTHPPIEERIARLEQM